MKKLHGNCEKVNMAKSLIGKISEFDEQQESFENYVERLGHFYKVNNITDEGTKVSLFVSIMGPALYGTLKDLLHPTLVKDENFSGMIKVLKSHFTPKVNITYERFIFNKRAQKDGESLTDYSVQLKKLAATCNFSNFLDEALRDRFLCGLKNPQIQSKLLSEGDSLTFSKALELALLMENADRNAKCLHPDRQVSYENVNWVKPGQMQNRPKPQFQNKGQVQFSKN